MSDEEYPRRLAREFVTTQPMTAKTSLVFAEERVVKDSPSWTRRREKGEGEPEGSCSCPCHVDGVNIFCSCWVSCCARPGKKYVSAEGRFDEERFQAHLRREERNRAHARETAGGKRRPGKCECGRRWNKRGFCSVCDEGKERT